MKPIVYYGSSITHGGCASRPGTCYENAISQRLNVDHINLGFSGSARAEDAMVEYISGLDMSVFVMDYDHNSPSEEHLQSTHEKMFLKIRERNKELPIIIMPRPKRYLLPFEKRRFEIIKATYENAIARGDKNVYFISNTELTRICKNEGTVDGTHPTDLGFFSMSVAVEKVLKKILKHGK